MEKYFLGLLVMVVCAYTTIVVGQCILFSMVSFHIIKVHFNNLQLLVSAEFKSKQENIIAKVFWFVLLSGEFVND